MKTNVWRFALFSIAALLSALVTVLSFCPAAWLAVLLEKQTQGRLTLGDTQGTLWQGSGFIGAAPNGNDPVIPLLPGRFSWHLSPLVFIGKVKMRLENPQSLSQPIELTGTWDQWQISNSSVLLPAERLTGLGAPLNTLGPSGNMRLSWKAIELTKRGQQLDLTGSTILELNNIGSLVSAVKPLGAYRVTMEWQGQQAKLALVTVNGPLLLNGTGRLQQGGFEFSGKAEAAIGHEETLANLLNILGQRRKEGNKNIIALEFRQ
jgi:general secretion pathway protein N